MEEPVTGMLIRLDKDCSPGLHGVAPMLLNGAWYDIEISPAPHKRVTRVETFAGYCLSILLAAR